MEDLGVIKEENKTKLVYHFEGGESVMRERKREKKRGRRGRKRKRRAKGMDFVWIFMGFYGLVWILV